MHPESQYLGEPTSVHITEAIHQAQHKPLPSTQSKSERGSSLPPVAQLLNKQVTFPFESDSDSSYTLPDQSDPEIVFWRQPSRLETLNILIDELQSFSQGNTMQTSEQFQSAIEPDDQYIDDTFADHSKMADDSVAYDTSANRDQSNREPLNSFGTHVNTSWNMIDDVGNQQFADVSATLSQITEELSKISANQIHFKEGMEK